MQRRGEKDAPGEPLLGPEGSHLPPSAPFEGIRVVELATVVAAPSCTMLMAVMGAEVVKVESKKGDMWRSFAKVLQPGRKKKGQHSGAFDLVNFNKTSVRLDVQTKQGQEALFALLADADVFVTNLKPSALKRNGLELETLRQKFPKLVSAQLLAHGHAGPLLTRPGYDVGAFWMATGMADLFVSSDRYINYPVSFGDLTTGQVLMAGLLMALFRRQRTGEGAIVSASLFETALWALAPQVNGHTPVEHVAYQHYRTADGEVVGITHQYDDDADARLRQVLNVDSGAGTAEVRAKVATLVSSDFLARLHSVGLSYSTLVKPEEIAAGPPEELKSIAAPPCPGVEDIQYPPSTPFRFQDAEAIWRHGGPKLGNGDEQLARGSIWKPRKERRPDAAIIGVQEPLLTGVTVIEYSVTSSAAIAGAGSMLAELGATVFRVETDESRRVAAALPAVWKAQLHGRKQSVGIQDACDAAQKDGAVTVLLTDIAESRQSFKTPEKCSVVRFDVGSGALGSWYLPSAIAAQMRGWDTSMDLKQVPSQTVDLLAAYNLVCATAGTLYRQQRGDGPTVANADMLRLGVYHGMLPYALYGIAPEYVGGFTRGHSLQDQKDMHPVPSAQMVNLTDGECVCLLGADLGKDLPRLLKALGVVALTILQILAVLPRVAFTCGKPFLLKVRPIFQILNRNIADNVKPMDTKQFLDWAAAKKWSLYTFRGRAVDMPYSEQARALESFTDTPDGFLVRQPLRVYY
eukprot:TRINITY_DN45255_c0_g1_i1.p1 TRINITY_DN45255_c0_g1~~TRINITY_DN45255_c0_g1_i1.p1  ORF type:complete len:772 (+),score=107.75 TRINITY_DN45255_c0_g1_i1:79-2316(+)